MEGRREGHSPKGRKNRRERLLLGLAIKVFGLALYPLGLYARGVRNAQNLRLTELELALDGLPQEFDGYRILQLSDLHVDAMPENLESASRLVSDLEVDLCVLTGDFRHRVTGPFGHILPPIRKLLKRVRARDGIYGILGNHDGADMVGALEDLGIRLLINETASIRRDGVQIHVTGTDDVHHFYTSEAALALGDAPVGFKIALVHSAELAPIAAEHGFGLYLSGHTHGGQVCLPGGRPIVTRMRGYRKYASGLWRCGEMIGYTSTGVGVASPTVRFNTRGEVALMTLRKA